MSWSKAAEGWNSQVNTEEGRDLASVSTKQVEPTAALLHHAHFTPPSLEAKHEDLEVLPSQVVALYSTFWNSQSKTEEGRDLASDWTKQVPPTAALLHQEHFSPLEEPVMQVNTEEGRDLASDSLKQVAPTAALLHQEHFWLPSLPAKQDFSEV
eukprot:gene9002-6465_t